MNLVKHHILAILSEEDITDEFERRVGRKPHERLLRVDMEINCYGHEERVRRDFFEGELEKAKERGFYLA